MLDGQSQRWKSFYLGNNAAWTSYTVSFWYHSFVPQLRPGEQFNVPVCTILCAFAETSIGGVSYLCPEPLNHHSIFPSVRNAEPVRRGGCWDGVEESQESCSVMRPVCEEVLLLSGWVIVWCWRSLRRDEVRVEGKSKEGLGDQTGYFVLSTEMQKKFSAMGKRFLFLSITKETAVTF